MQFADNRHATDEVLERYSMNSLAGPELAEFEEHLLVCASCQDRLAHEDTIGQRIRDGAAGIARPRTRAVRLPRLAWAAGLAAVALALFAGVGWRDFSRSNEPPAMVLLQATRGAELPTLATAPARKPLTLELDLTDTPQFSAYRWEIVDAAGHPVRQSSGIARSNKLQATLAHGLAAGAYFVRLYAPSGELLREYALAVRG